MSTVDVLKEVETSLLTLSQRVRDISNTYHLDPNASLLYLSEALGDEAERLYELRKDKS